MRKPCIVKPLLTMQGFSFAGCLFLLSAASGFAQGNRIYWLCGKSNANPAGTRAAFSDFHAPGFAQGNRIYWLCGKSGANRAGARAAFSDFHAPGFAQGNRVYWLCGKSGANRAGARAAFSDFHAPGFAQRNRIYWLCGKSGANRAGSRAACFLCAARSRHQYTWRMASMMFSAPTMEIPARVNLLFFFGRIIFS